MIRVARVEPLRGALESTRYLRKWVGIAVLIGIVAGVGALIFSAAIQYATQLFLGVGVGYLPPSPAGEGATTIQPLWTAPRAWLLPLVTAIGGLISGIIVFTFAPEAEGHGTDAAIAAVHFQRGRIRARIPLVKIVASAITIGSGGSAGREGPTAQISAGFGSLLGDLLHLSDDDRRLAVSIGIGAGIGAIFRAPLGGAVLAAEILYLHDIEVEAIIPALIASIVGFSIFGSFVGFQPVFGNLNRFEYAQPIQLLYYAVLGIVCGGIGMLYARGFYGITDAFHHLEIPRPIKPAIGGFLVGLMGLAIPQVIGMGYGWVQVAMGPSLLSIPLWIVLILPFAKIVSTGLSIGSGGSGGIFGPGMVIGGTVGASLWRLGYELHVAGLPPDPTPFVIIGMMALFGGIAHAPLAVMLMVAEMTGNLSLLGPAMLAVGISYLLVGNNTIYENQIGGRSDSPTHRAKFRFPLLASLTVADSQVPVPVQLRPDLSIAEASTIIATRAPAGAPVVDDHGRLIGVLAHADVRALPPDQTADMRVEQAMNRAPVTSRPSETLDRALEALATSRVRWLPVVTGKEQQLVGIVTAADVVRAYRTALNNAVRGVSGLASGGTVFDLTVRPASLVAGHTLAELRLMPETLVLSVQRADEVLVPNATSQLVPGDVVTVLTRGRPWAELHHLFEEPAEVAAGAG